MTPDRIAEAAECLVRAVQEGRQLRDFPTGCRPTTVEQADAIADLMAARLGGAPGGWKIGATNESMRARLGLAGPFRGRILASMIFWGPVQLHGADILRPGVEPEVCFRLARGLPPRSRPYTAADVAAAVGTAHPALEVPEGRFTEDHQTGIYGMFAAQGSSGRLVLGPAAKDWRDLDLARLAVVLTVNGGEIARGTGAAVMGNPLEALAWLANDRCARGDGLKPGQFVTTGSLTAFHPVAVGDRIVADFGPFGRAELDLLA